MCESGGLKRGEPQGGRPELCAVEPAQVVGDRLGGQAAEMLEELAAGDAFAPSGPRRCSGTAADLQPAVMRKQAGVVEVSAPAEVDGCAVGHEVVGEPVQCDDDVQPLRKGVEFLIQARQRALTDGPPYPRL